jgi:hypothetical protein
MVDTICSAKSNSGFDEYHQGAVASQQHAKILSDFLNTYCSIDGISHLPLCEEMVS